MNTINRAAMLLQNRHAVNHMAFIRLRELGKPVISYPRVIFDRCGDIHPRSQLSFPQVTSVCLYRCDKNFVYYWLHGGIFPNLVHIDLLSHPCEPDVLSRFTCPIQMDQHYFKPQWTTSQPHVSVISADDKVLIQHELALAKQINPPEDIHYDPSDPVNWPVLV